MVSVIISAAAGWLSPRDRPASWPGSSSAVPISTSLNATGIPWSSTIWSGVRRSVLDLPPAEHFHHQD
jgi:hypothetical protein